MIKQQQRVIKKGDYYEMQAAQETMMMISKTRKEQTTSTITSQNQAQSESLLTVVPTFQSARDMYFCSAPKDIYAGKNIAELKDQLELMAKEEGLNDQDRNEIEKLIEQIDLFRDNKQQPLNQLTQTKDTKSQAKQPSNTQINLTARYNIKQLTQRIQKLQTLDFPDLINLQHQLEIMLGEKKPLQSMQLPQMDEKEKQEFNNLYNHLNSLSILNNTQRTIESISLNEEKHVEMQSWVEKMQTAQGLNNDFLAELKQDSQLIQKLEKNFNQNVKQVREIIKQLSSK